MIADPRAGANRGGSVAYAVWMRKRPFHEPRRRDGLARLFFCATVMSCAALLFAATTPATAQGTEADTPPAAQAQAKQAPAESEPTLHDLAGVTAMRRRLGVRAPAGRGVVIAQVEGQPGDYLPITEGTWTGSTVVVAQGGPSETFGHAAGVGRVIYGTGGIAPGIELVHSYPVKAWMRDVLRFGTPHPPAETAARVTNHSWIAMDHPHAARILRRVDWLVDQRGALVVAGVNNGRGRVPDLLAPSFNAIAVGKRGGNNSGGYTTVEIPGRCKPDLVAAGGVTSTSTAVVTGIVACMLEHVDNLPPRDAEPAGRPETIKACLLAGARRDDAWQPESGKPLDNHLGAGEADVDRAMLCLLAGRVQPGKLRRRAGWALETLGSGDAHRYRLHVSQPMGALGVALTWHRRVDGRTATDDEGNPRGWVDAPRLTDFDLRVLDADTGEPLAASESAVDNVELIHLPETASGRYVLEVERLGKGRDARWRYALAFLLDKPDR